MTGTPTAAARRALRHAAKAAGRQAARARPAQSLAMAAAARRRHGLVLLYHRVVASDRLPALRAVPAVPIDVFRAQVAALCELGEVVPLERLLERPDQRTRPRFALTFDDDFAGHLDTAVPVLRELGLPATFFLSGRGLHRLGGYWFDALDRLLAERGLAAAQRLLGITETTPAAVAQRCETDQRLQQTLEAIASDENCLDQTRVRALAGAGMTIGFHTVGHHRLPELGDTELAQALTAGRGELAQAAGHHVDLFAYPHGLADARVAEATRAAGYRAAWTGWPRPASPRDDRYRLGRWEPGALPAQAFRAAVAIRLHRTAPAE
jgi:peptidoglycan/xylan/chitin deacetylase (PgdA/CDA1 family)